MSTNLADNLKDGTSPGERIPPPKPNHDPNYDRSLPVNTNFITELLTNKGDYQRFADFSDYPQIISDLVGAGYQPKQTILLTGGEYHSLGTNSQGTNPYESFLPPDDIMNRPENQFFLRSIRLKNVASLIKVHGYHFDRDGKQVVDTVDWLKPVISARVSICGPTQEFPFGRVITEDIWGQTVDFPLFDSDQNWLLQMQTAGQERSNAVSAKGDYEKADQKISHTLAQNPRVRQIIGDLELGYSGTQIAAREKLEASKINS